MANEDKAAGKGRLSKFEESQLSSFKGVKAEYAGERVVHDSRLLDGLVGSRTVPRAAPGRPAD